MKEKQFSLGITKPKNGLEVKTENHKRKRDVVVTQ